jgi:hypothetical protein
VTINIILCLLPDDLANILRPIVATKSLDKHLLLFIPIGYKVVLILLALAREQERRKEIDYRAIITRR